MVMQYNVGADILPSNFLSMSFKALKQGSHANNYIPNQKVEYFDKFIRTSMIPGIVGTAFKLATSLQDL